MRRKIRAIVLVVVAIPIIMFAAQLLYIEWKWSGDVQTSLDRQYIPTAQALVENPVPTPRFLNIDPPPGSIVQRGDILQIATNPYRLSASALDIGEWTQFFINNARIGRSNYSYGLGGSSKPPDETYDPNFSFIPRWQPGLHLIEIRVGTSITALLNPAEARSYTWAYRVE